MSGLSKKALYSAIAAVIIILTFFIIKTLVMISILPCNTIIQWYEYLSIICFMPVFFILFKELIIKQRENSLRAKSLQSILDESCLVSHTDKQGRITEVNAKFCEVSGYKRHELLGKDHNMLNSGIHPKSMWAEMYQTTIQYQSIWHEIITNKNKNGEQYIVDSYIMATFDNAKKHTGFISVRQDITELMNSIQEVDRKNAYLEHAAKILRHDMHSGINTYIPRGISSLKRRLDKLLCEKGQKNIAAPMKMLKEGLAHAQRVYNGVKEFTNLVKRDAVIERHAYNLTHILNEYLKGTSYKSMVSIDELGTENVNESLFCTAIDNLIRNGLRYNDSDTKIVKLYRQDNILVVEDNGRGMTQKEFEELAQPYTRGSGQKESGSGLGLNICVAIMQEHGFEVTCEKIKSGTKLKIKVA